MRVTTIAALAVVAGMGAVVAPASLAAAGPCANPTIQAVIGQPTYGTLGADVIRGTAFDDTIFGLGGGDVICGLGGDDNLYDGETDTTNDRFYGGGGDDALLGGGGANRLFGGPGDDRLLGGYDPANSVKADRCDGGKGVDVAFIGSCEIVVAIEKEQVFL